MMVRRMERKDWARQLSRGVRASIAATALIGGVLGLPNENGRTPAAYAQFVKSIEEDHDTYYRLKVKLTYWGTPQDFDIVVGCNVKQIFYKDGGTTYEAGLVPTVFGRQMYDGKGLVIRPPDACKGQTTANRMVPADFLPLIVVYDNADTLDFGVAYLSDDAYENPLSVLGFGGASIDKATRDEFDAFRRAQPNLVTRESYWGRAGDEVLKRMKLTRPARPWAYSCETYKRFRIPEELRPFVREHWPDGNPHYWQIMNGQALGQFEFSITHRSLLQSDRKDDPVRPFGSFGPANGADSGLMRRNGGGLITLYPSKPISSTAVSPAFYPVANEFRHPWPADPKERTAYLAGLDKIAVADLDFRGGFTKGFAYCFTHWVPSAERGVPEWMASKRIIGRVDGEDIVPNRAIGGVWAEPSWLFEHDEYVFLLFQVYLTSTRGDV
jgi:hypothetical protein